VVVLAAGGLLYRRLSRRTQATADGAGLSDLVASQA
jgi:hypothetical protein